jgi:hypothetical protein
MSKIKKNQSEVGAQVKKSKQESRGLLPKNINYIEVNVAKVYLFFAPAGKFAPKS